MPSQKTAYLLGSPIRQASPHQFYTGWAFVYYVNFRVKSVDI